MLETIDLTHELAKEVYKKKAPPLGLQGRKP